MINIPNTGYKTAQNYYAALKEQFIQQMGAYSKKEGVQLTSQWAQEIQTQFSNGIESQGVNKGKTSFDILNEIFQKFSTSSSIQKLHQDALRRIEEEEKKFADLDKAAQYNHIAEIMSAYTAEQYQIIQESMVAAINTTPGMNSITLSELVHSANQMFRISLIAHLRSPHMTKYALRGLVAVTRQGYIREQMELNGLKKAFKNTPVKATHGGAKKVDGKETVFDNILSFIDFSEDLFTQQVQGTAIVNLQQGLEAALLPQISYYGEQIKSFNLRTSRTSQIHHITNNKSLYNQLLSQTTKRYIGLKENLSFLAQANNILTTFGPATVLFSSGAGRQWMDDFIEDFRKRDYYLGFTYKDPIKGIINSDISLMSPWVTNMKTKFQKRRTIKSLNGVKN